MDKQQMIDKIKKYLANNYNCDIKELDRKGLHIIKNNSEKN